MGFTSLAGGFRKPKITRHIHQVSMAGIAFILKIR
jgi:hypothetical protein